MVWFIITCIHVVLSHRIRAVSNNVLFGISWRLILPGILLMKFSEPFLITPNLENFREHHAHIARFFLPPIPLSGVFYYNQRETVSLYYSSSFNFAPVFNNPVLNALNNPPNPWPGQPLLRQVSCAIALNLKYKEEDKAFSTVGYSLKRSTHLTQYSLLLCRYSKTKNIFLQWAECNGFFPFMFGGSKHSILPPSKLLRCEFLSARAISSICNTWSVVVSHDHGL